MHRGLPRSALGPFAGFASFGILWGAWAALVPLTRADVGASEGALGLALLCVAVGSLPAMLLVGPAINRRGRRVLPWVLAAQAVTAVLIALAGSVPVLAAALFAMGAASGAVDVAINSAAGDVEAHTGRRVMQLAHALFSAGVLAGAVGAGLAREAGAGRLPILAAVAVVILAAALANRGAASPAPAAASRSRIRFRRPFVLIGIACGAAFLVEGGIENWSALYLEQDLDATPALSALGPGAYALAMVTGRLTGQWLTGRLPDRVLLACGAAVATVGLVLTTAAPGVPMAVLSFFLGGLGVSVAAPVALAAAGRGAPAGERGSAVATVTTIGYLGFLVGPAMTGAAAEVVGLRAAFLLLAAVAAALAAGALRLRLGDEAAAGVRLEPDPRSTP
jgi:MFS family permease